MSRITYRQPDARISVYLDGKVVGTISRIGTKFRYRPKGSRLAGELFDTVEACKASLESDFA